MAATSESRPLTATELIRQRATTEPAEVATYHRLPSGDWKPTTWRELWTDVERVASAFRSLGLERGDRLAIMSHTCREWQLAEFGAALQRAAVIGVDTHASPAQIDFIVRRSGATALVADNEDSLSKIPQPARAAFKFIVLLQPFASASLPRDIVLWNELLKRADAAAASGADAGPAPDDPAVVIFTSGTTGEPKGIPYSHRDVMSACWAMVDAYASLSNGRLVCWLPMSALFQRMMNLVGFGHHSATYFVDDPREIMTRLPEIKPTALTSVPRFYERVHDGIRAQLGKQRGLAKRLADVALKVGDRWSRAVRSGQRPSFLLRMQHSALDALVLRRIRAALGGEIKSLISGSAAIPVWLIDFFYSLGLPVLEAYGVTENPLPVAGNTPEDCRVGSVGKPFRGNDVRLSDDGEVLLKGATLFRGYLGEPFPRDRFTEDGYYRTGDYGRFDADGYLYLTGRVADMIKTSSGRRVAPAGVEAAYGRSRFIEQICVFGANQPYLVALIVPNWAALRDALAIEPASSTPLPADRMNAAGAILKAEVDRIGSELAAYERVRDFALVQSPFSIESGLLTATLKLRRAHIELAYRELIASLYRPASRPLAVQT